MDAAKLSYSKRALHIKPDGIDKVFKTVMANPQIISFAAGVPDTSLLPIELLGKLNDSAIKKYGRAILQYGIPSGFPPLIEAVKPLLQKRGIDTSTESIHISTGGSGELNNACMVFLDENDTVLVETPTYSPAVNTFKSYGANVVSVLCDDNGMMLDDLEEKLRSLKPKVVYLLPTFQNPSGRVMPLERRKGVANLVDKYNTVIFEDDVYYDLRYECEHIPAIQSLIPERVVYMSSVSKILAPAMRVGFCVVPKESLQRFLILKHIIDMTTSPYTQALTAEFLISDDGKTHMNTLIESYKKKSLFMVKMLKENMPEGFTWNEPVGGLFLWIRGPKDFDSDLLLDTAIENNVAYMPGSGFYAGDSKEHNNIRLSFANPSIEKIEEGIKILSQIIKMNYEK